MAALGLVVANAGLPGRAVAATITWRGTVDGAWNTTTANWAGGAATFTTGDTVVFDDTATGTTGITVGGPLAPAGTVTVTNTTKNYSFSGAGGLSGTLNLTKLGPGTLTLSNSNAFTGTTTLRGGTTVLAASAVYTATTGSASSQSFVMASTAGDNATLVVKDSASLTTNIVRLATGVGSQATVLMQGGTFSTSNNGNSGNGIFFRIGESGTATWNQTGGLLSIDGQLPTIGRLAGSSGQMTVSSGTVRITGAGVAGSYGYLAVGFDGTGTLTLSGSGVVETGTSSVGQLVVVNSGTGRGTVNLDGGTLRTRQISTTGVAGSVSTVNLNGGTVVALASSGSFFQGLTAANVKPGGAVFNTNGFDITVAQPLLDSGTGALRKLGAGTLTLSGSSTYRGGTTVESGTLRLGHAAALGWSGGSLAVNSAARLDLAGFNATVGSLALNGGSLWGFTLGGSPNRLAAATATTSGTTYLNVSGTTPGTYSLITSAGGGLGGAFAFEGGQAVSVPATRMIARNNGGFLDYRLSATSTATQLAVTAAGTAGRISIMSLGASISGGVSATGTAQNGDVIASYNGFGYRTQLYQRLVNDGRFVPNFVGTSTTSYAVSASGSSLLQYADQTRHQGHSGYTTSQILWNLANHDGNPSNAGGFWLSGTTAATSGADSPDVIALYVGGNDFGQAQFRNAGPIERYDATLTEIRSLRPNAAVIAHTLMYRTDVGSYQGTYFNPYVEGVVYDHVLAGEDVRFLDLAGLLTPGNDGTRILSRDGIHPTQAGYNMMGDAIQMSIVYGAAYWSGRLDGNWSTLVGGTSTNWSMDRAGRFDRQARLDAVAATRFTDPFGTVRSFTPDVFFVTSGTVATTLDADTGVRGLNFTSGASGAVSISGSTTLTLGSGGITVQRGSGGHTLAANVALAADQTWGNVSANDFLVTGSLTGTAGLSIAGGFTTRTLTTLTTGTGTGYSAEIANTSGTTTVGAGGGIVLAGNNLGYSGAITVERYATLKAGHRNALGGGAARLVLDGGTLDLDASSPVVGLLTGTAGTISTSRAATVVLTASSGLSGTFSGLIGNGAGTLGLTKTGTGTLTLAGTAANTFTGVTTISAGSLVLGKTAGVAAIGGPIQLGDGAGADILRLAADEQIADTSVITFTGTAVSQRGWLQLNGFDETIGGLASAGPGHGLVGNEAGVGSNSVLTLAVTGTHDFSGLVRNASGSGGTLSLVKAGAGLQVLSGSSTYSGSTGVAAGRLEIAAGGRLAATSAVSVAAGAELRVFGSVNSAAAVDVAGVLSGTGSLGAVVLGGTLAPGASIGTLSTAGLTWNGGAVGLFELGGLDGAADRLAITGDFLRGSGSGFVFDFAEGGAWSGGQPTVYTLVTWTGTTTFAAADFTAANLAAGLWGEFAIQGNELRVVVVPEPASIALLVGGAAIAAATRKSGRRRRPGRLSDSQGNNIT